MSSVSSALEGGNKQEDDKSVCTCLRGPNTARMGAVCAKPVSTEEEVDQSSNVSLVTEKGTREEGEGGLAASHLNPVVS